MAKKKTREEMAAPLPGYVYDPILTAYQTGDTARMWIALGALLQHFRTRNIGRYAVAVAKAENASHDDFAGGWVALGCAMSVHGEAQHEINRERHAVAKKEFRRRRRR